MASEALQQVMASLDVWFDLHVGERKAQHSPCFQFDGAPLTGKVECCGHVFTFTYGAVA